eukprot:scaffold315492_cov46-Attheya_sp.AAC.1
MSVVLVGNVFGFALGDSRGNESAWLILIVCPEEGFDMAPAVRADLRVGCWQMSLCTRRGAIIGDTNEIFDQ